MTGASPEARWLAKSGEVSSDKVCCRCCISIVQRSGGDAFICFCMSGQTKRVVYSVGGDILCWLRWWSKKGELSKVVSKCNSERIKGKRRS